MGFQERLDPNGNKQRQFDRIIDFLATAPRPKTDYRLLTHIDFLGLDFLRRLLEIQTSYMLLFRSFAAMYQQRRYLAEPVAKKGYLSLPEILEWSHCGPRTLYETYCTYPDRGLIALFVDLKLEEPFFRDEFVARLEGKQVASELILIDWGGLDRQKEFEKLLRVNRIKSFRPEKQSDEDIRQSAWAKTWEEWRKPGIISDDELTPLPEFPGAPYLKMLPPEKEFWEGPMAKAWHDGKLAFLRDGIPALAGDKESILETVRQHRRNEWKTIAREQKILDDPVAQEETRRQLFKRDSKPDVSSNMVSVLRVAKKRWGANAARALQYLLEDKTEEAAARLTGITARTLRNYILKLTKEFSQKK